MEQKYNLNVKRTALGSQFAIEPRIAYTNFVKPKYVICRAEDAETANHLDFAGDTLQNVARDMAHPFSLAEIEQARNIIYDGELVSSIADAITASLGKNSQLDAPRLNITLIKLQDVCVKAVDEAVTRSISGALNDSSVIKTTVKETEKTRFSNTLEVGGKSYHSKINYPRLREAITSIVRLAISEFMINSGKCAIPTTPALELKVAKETRLIPTLEVLLQDALMSDIIEALKTLKDSAGISNDGMWKSKLQLADQISTIMGYCFQVFNAFARFNGKASVIYYLIDRYHQLYIERSLEPEIHTPQIKEMIDQIGQYYNFVSKILTPKSSFGAFSSLFTAVLDDAGNSFLTTTDTVTLAEAKQLLDRITSGNSDQYSVLTASEAANMIHVYARASQSGSARLGYYYTTAIPAVHEPIIFNKALASRCHIPDLSGYRTLAISYCQSQMEFTGVLAAIKEMSSLPRLLDSTSRITISNYNVVLAALNSSKKEEGEAEGDQKEEGNSKIALPKTLTDNYNAILNLPLEVKEFYPRPGYTTSSKSIFGAVTKDAQDGEDQSDDKTNVEVVISEADMLWDFILLNEFDVKPIGLKEYNLIKAASNNDLVDFADIKTPPFLVSDKVGDERRVAIYASQDDSISLKDVFSIDLEYGRIAFFNQAIGVAISASRKCRNTNVWSSDDNSVRSKFESAPFQFRVNELLVASKTSVSEKSITSVTIPDLTLNVKVPYIGGVEEDQSYTVQIYKDLYDEASNVSAYIKSLKSFRSITRLAEIIVDHIAEANGVVKAAEALNASESYIKTLYVDAIQIISDRTHGLSTYVLGELKRQISANICKSSSLAAISLADASTVAGALLEPNGTDTNYHKFINRTLNVWSVLMFADIEASQKESIVDFLNAAFKAIHGSDDLTLTISWS